MVAARSDAAVIARVGGLPSIMQEDIEPAAHRVLQPAIVARGGLRTFPIGGFCPHRCFKVEIPLRNFLV
jgi:hypothetical protein